MVFVLQAIAFICLLRIETASAFRHFLSWSRWKGMSSDSLHSPTHFKLLFCNFSLTANNASNSFLSYIKQLSIRHLTEYILKNGYLAVRAI